jgi:hypothetical protein
VIPVRHAGRAVTADPRTTTHPGSRALLALALAAILAVRFRDGTGNIIDDAYLTLRDARNFARGAGLVYNAGEPVLGTTTPLFALLHGAIGAVVGSAWIPVSAVIGNAVCDALAFLLLFRWIGEAAGARLVGLAAAAAYGLAPRAVEYSSGGMEAPLYTLLILIALRATARESPSIAGLASGLAIVCRPDAVVVGAVVFAWLTASSRRLPWRFLATLAVVMAPWVAYACFVYPWGPIPQSVIAKWHRPWLVARTQALFAFVTQLAATGIGRPLMTGAMALGEHFQSEDQIVSAATAAAITTNVGLLVLGARRLGRDGWILLSFGVSYAALFAWGNPLMLGWYQVPLEAVFPALLAGATTVFRSPRARNLALALIVAIPGTVLLARDNHISYVLRERWDKRRERGYFECAERIRPALPSGATVMGSENGVLGWALEGRVLDTVGLITPGAARFYPVPASQIVTDMAVPPALVLTMRPDVFVSLEVFVRRTCLVDPTFQAAYAIDESLSDRSQSTFGSRGLLVFRRRSAESASHAASR